MAATVAVPRGTLSALRHANFRLYFAGQLASASGTWMQNVAQGFLVYQITHSELWLGIVACAAGLPLVVLSPFAGVIVERVPRRPLMIFTQTAQMILAFILAALVFANVVQVWHIVVLAFFLGASNALDAPARQVFTVEMVGREDLQSGIALISILNSGSRVFGPAAAGITLNLVGPAWCFFINGLSFLAVIASLLIMKVPFAINRVSDAHPIQQLKDGLNYSRQDMTVAPLLLLTALVGFFGLPFLQFLPAFASAVLHSPTDGLAALSAGQGIGSVVAGAIVTRLATRFGRGRLVAAMVVLAAIATYLFSRMTNIPMATLFSALTGLFVVLEVVNFNVLIQTTVPDHFRGRVLSLYSLAFFGLAPFGSLALGALANQIGVQDGLAVFGILGGVLGVFVLARWRGIIR